MSRDLLVGVDIGGTFTDAAVVDEEGRVAVGKVPSTPDDFSEGFFGAIADAAKALDLETDELLRRTRRLAHGTTVGINALVTRTGARVGLLTTKGHADALRIRDNTGRVTGATVHEILDYAASTLPTDFVERGCTREIVERVDFAGDVVVELDRTQAETEIRALLDAGVGGIAISLLWAFANPEHEQQLEAMVRELAPDVFVNASHAVAPRIGEYPRAATTVFNAYIGPLMRGYIENITRRATELGYGEPVLFATCSGGLVHPDVARDFPLLTVKSGPVAGVVATTLLGEQAGWSDVIATDMGGTTLDVSVVAGGRTPASETSVIERHEALLRMVDVESVGAGGGSIAWIDPDTGGLRVGPHSAGAVPGPACYGLGGPEPTVTDADLILGVLDPEGLLGGTLKLDLERAEEAVGRLAAQAGLSLLDCAAGIVEIVDAQMEDLVRRMTVQQGRDPRDFVLFGFGGGAAAHASLYGRGLGVSQLVIPMADVASVWSALGVALSDVVRFYERSVYMPAPFDPRVVATAVEELEEQARADMATHGLDDAELRLRRTADLRYGLQVFEVEAPVPDGDLRDAQQMEALVGAFERAYADRYGAGSGYAEAGVLLTALRVEARGVAARPSLQAARGAAAGGAATGETERHVYWWELRRRLATPVHAGAELTQGRRIEGPAIIQYPDTTAVVRPGQRAEVDALGSLVIDMPEGAVT